jgi:hypothetical protein
MGTRKSAQAEKRVTRPAAPRRTTERAAAAPSATKRPAAVAQLALDLPPAATPAPACASPDRLSHPPIVLPTPAQGVGASGGRLGAKSHHFGELRDALAQGWEIVQPIFARPLWSAPDDSATAFNFVLRSAHGTRLITVPQGRTVERFIRDRHLTVDHAH